jgi:hypothetical protein
MKPSLLLFVKRGYSKLCPFVKVFNYSIPKLLKLVGGKAAIGCEKNIVLSI